MKRILYLIIPCLLLLCFSTGALAAEAEDFESYLSTLKDYENPLSKSSLSALSQEQIDARYKATQSALEKAAKRIADRKKDEIVYIATAEDFYDYCDRVNRGYTDLDGELLADIDLSEQNYTFPILYHYNGTFVGNGFCISGLKGSNYYEMNGLFGAVMDAVIDGVQIEGDFSGLQHVGGIAGYSRNSTITNCVNKGNVNARAGHAGGIVGYADTGTTIAGCYNAGNIFTALNWGESAFAGGIVGATYEDTFVYSCYNAGEVLGIIAGGIVGNNNAIVANCYNIGTVRDYLFESGGIVNFNAPNAFVANSFYLDSSADIGLPRQYGDGDEIAASSSAALKGESVLQALNTNSHIKTKFFAADNDGINEGYPVLTWQETYTRYKIAINNGTTSKTEARAGEKIFLSAPWALGKKINWQTDPKLDLTPIHGNNFNVSFIMPEADVTISAEYVSDPAPFLFQDVPADHWAASDIYELYDYGLIAGKTAAHFDPETYITRAEFVKLLAGLVSEAEINRYEHWGNPFWDVPADAWYAKYVTWSANNNIIYGNGDGYFRPNDHICREEMASILYNYMYYYERKTLPETYPFKSFTDWNQISEYAISGVVTAQMAGIIQGYQDGSFRPQSNTTRAEAARVFNMFLKARAESTRIDYYNDEW